jgi:hypothetical protein
MSMSWLLRVVENQTLRAARKSTSSGAAVKAQATPSSRSGCNSAPAAHRLYYPHEDSAVIPDRVLKSEDMDDHPSVRGV